MVCSVNIRLTGPGLSGFSYNKKGGRKFREENVCMGFCDREEGTQRAQQEVWVRTGEVFGCGSGQGLSMALWCKNPGDTGCQRKSDSI